MAQPTDANELKTAWRALAGQGNAAQDGWRTIPIASDLSVKMQAGRHFPGNEEALFVQFDATDVPPDKDLPTGHGFRVSIVDIGERNGAKKWISLSRLPAGSLDMFSVMAADILSTMSAMPSATDSRLAQCFLSRIAGWQYFMERSGLLVLSPEGEVGLVGELLVLHDLLDAGLHAEVVVDAWRGPTGTLRDFEIGTGSIEVKCSLSTIGFPATIGSLNQLDIDSLRPLILAGIRLTVSQAGLTLPELVAELRKKLSSNAKAIERFSVLILRAGFFDAQAEHYTRKFSRVTMKLFPVSEEFPRLTPRNIPLAIVSAQYVIDLDQVRIAEIELGVALKDFGVT